MTTNYGCDSCTLCCKFMKIKELNKASHSWCEKCEIGIGCGAYESRPEPCRVYECIWLQTQRLPNSMPFELRPDKSKVIVGTINDGEDMVFYVSPERPDAWKQGPFGKFVSEMRMRGFKMYVSIGDDLKPI